MFNRIFNKYFMTIALTVIISFFVLGAAMLTMTASYSVNEKERSLYINAQKVAEMTSSLIEGGTFTDKIVYENVLSLFAQGSDTDMFITDTDGNIIIWLKSSKKRITTKVIDSKILNIAYVKGIYRSTGKFANLYKDNRYTVGVPYRLSGGNLGGVVFLSSPASSLNQLLIDVGKIFFAALVLMLLVSFAGLYYATNKLTKPLKAMSLAANKFAKGEFDARLPVTSNDEVGQLAMAFNKMAESLNEIEDTRRGLIANISHDLKTPMTSISGFIDGILDGTIPEERHSHYLKLVSDETKRLSRLVNSVLDMARLESGADNLKKSIFNLNEMVSKVLIAHEIAINEKKLEVNVDLPDEPATVIADEDSVYRVIQNLVENAVKFVNEGGNIDISIAFRNKMVLTSIKNTGQGIASEDVPHVFERFFKADKSRGKDKNSAGLGLYITKSIINLNGGEIWVKSVEGQYTEFVFTLKKCDINKA